MCVANSARSQIAEGLARQLFPDAEIQSAGSHPGTLNPYAVTVLKEIGLDISKHFSKSYEELPPKFIANLDYVITLCAEEACPRMASKAQKLHWPFKDPASKEPLTDAESLKRFREARDGLRARLEDFKREMGR